MSFATCAGLMKFRVCPRRAKKTSVASSKERERSSASSLILISVFGVNTDPGQMALQVIPSISRISAAVARVSPSIACFETT